MLLINSLSYGINYVLTLVVLVASLAYDDPVTVSLVTPELFVVSVSVILNYSVCRGENITG